MHGDRNLFIIVRGDTTGLSISMKSIETNNCLLLRKGVGKLFSLEVTLFCQYQV